MNDFLIIVTLTHPPYNTRNRGGPSVRNPLPEHIDLAFRYTAEYGDGKVGDIWIKLSIKNEEGKLVDFKELVIAVSNEHDCCFLARRIGIDGIYQNLVWSHSDTPIVIIRMEDSGCGEWLFKADSKVPVADAISLAKRFAANGSLGEHLKWEARPTA
jgi:hypothetical protein